MVFTAIRRLREFTLKLPALVVGTGLIIISPFIYFGGEYLRIKLGIPERRPLPEHYPLPLGSTSYIPLVDREGYA